MRIAGPWPERVALTAVVVTASLVVVMAFAGTDPAGPKRDVARGGDLVAFWAGGAILAEDGHGRELYRGSRYRDEMAALFPPRPPRYQLAYPPPIYQACALLHGLGYAVGSRLLVLGMASLFAVGVLVLVGTSPGLGPRARLVAALGLASPSMWMMTLTGQFSGAWLLAVALAFAAVRRARRHGRWWLVAGLPLGVLCVKPTVALAALAALLLIGSGRALVGFAAGGAAVLMASLALHGLAPWRGYLAMLADNPDLAQQMWLMPERQLTVRSLLGLPAEPFGLEVAAGWVGAALAAALLAWAAPVCWRGARRHDTRALAVGLALSAALLGTPHLFDYDQCLHFPALAASVVLLERGRAHRARAGGLLVAAAWLAPAGYLAASWLDLSLGVVALVAWVIWLRVELARALATPSEAAGGSARPRRGGPGAGTGR